MRGIKEIKRRNCKIRNEISEIRKAKGEEILWLLMWQNTAVSKC
jgi:hypothetical protein